MSFLGGLFGGASSANKYLQVGRAERNKTLASITSDLSPYTSDAGAIHDQTLGLMGLGTNPQASYDQFRSAPGYQSGLNEGINAVDSSAAAKGLGQSGATLLALTKFGQDYADKGFQQYFQNVSGLDTQAEGATNTLDNYKNSVTSDNANAVAQMGANKANQANANLGLLGSLAGSAFKMFGG